MLRAVPALRIPRGQRPLIPRSAESQTFQHTNRQSTAGARRRPHPLQSRRAPWLGRARSKPLRRAVCCRIFCPPATVYVRVFPWFSMHTHRPTPTAHREDDPPQWAPSLARARATRVAPRRSGLWSLGSSPRAGLGLKVFDSQCLAVVPVLTDGACWRSRLLLLPVAAAVVVVVVAAVAVPLVAFVVLIVQ